MAVLAFNVDIVKILIGNESQEAKLSLLDAARRT